MHAPPGSGDETTRQSATRTTRHKQGRAPPSPHHGKVRRSRCPAPAHVALITEPAFGVIVPVWPAVEATRLADSRDAGRAGWLAVDQIRLPVHLSRQTQHPRLPAQEMLGVDVPAWDVAVRFGS